MQAFFVTYRIVMPLMWTNISVARLAGLFLLSDLVSSYWLALTFQANHVVEGVEWPTANEKKEIKMDWAKMQVVTAQDYAHKSFFWTNFAGALNFQIVHHLFPNVRAGACGGGVRSLILSRFCNTTTRRSRRS